MGENLGPVTYVVVHHGDIAAEYQTLAEAVVHIDKYGGHEILKAQQVKNWRDTPSE